MGLLVEGRWSDRWYDTDAGEFVRDDSLFRNWVTADGSPGPTGEGGFAAKADRYHLYVSLACPWAHRTLIFRRLKNLAHIIGVSIVEPLMLGDGWVFGAGGDGLYGLPRLRDIYTMAVTDYTGRVTVPVLWDKHRQTIVSNESAEIIRMLNSAFGHQTGDDSDYYPKPLRGEIDRLNGMIYHAVNNGVYRAGFATTQSAYERAYTELFAALDWLDTHLSRNRFLMGTTLTEADWRLFTTLIRFDAVYYGHFKTNKHRIQDYPNLFGYTCDLYQQPGIAETVDLAHIKSHYYGSHLTINPTGIVPSGPDLDFAAPHNRQHLLKLQTAGN